MTMIPCMMQWEMPRLSNGFLKESVKETTSRDGDRAGGQRRPSSSTGLRAVIVAGLQVGTPEVTRPSGGSLNRLEGACLWHQPPLM